MDGYLAIHLSDGRTVQAGDQPGGSCSPGDEALRHGQAGVGRDHTVDELNRIRYTLVCTVFLLYCRHVTFTEIYCGLFRANPSNYKCGKSPCVLCVCSKGKALAELCITFVPHESL